MDQDDGSSSATSWPLQLFSKMSLPPSLGGSPYPWLRELKSEERGLYLIHLLLACANYVSSGSLSNANVALDQISQLSSMNGDTMQRIAAYFAEALADRIIKSWPGLHRALNSTRVSILSDEMLVKKLFFEMFPFLKAGFVLANQAIIEAMEGEKMVHVIDLCGSEPSQWIPLLQALSARSGGPPHLRITGIHPEKPVLDGMAKRLAEEAEKLDIPFQFNPVVSTLDSLDFDTLRVKTGEALAISSFLQFHTLLASDDESTRKRSLFGSNGIHLQKLLQMNRSSSGGLLEKDPANGYSGSPDSTSSPPLTASCHSKIESFLSNLRGLSPKLVVVMEQDSNHNGLPLMERLTEALYSYAAMFDCLESTVPRTSVERLKLEKMMFGEEIKNIIACEGAERKERHERLEKWAWRLDTGGFKNVPLSYLSLLQARMLLQVYNCDSYRIKEENGCAVIYWQDRSLFSVSAWTSRK
ncbi:hypothetical protein CDL15_Pgr025348 [Punica granatum]|uniref:Uncharacterized protein n=2 Tax=Punica granatum TaxID=22663 RepID=A0A218WAC0_PUNGR|nr:hypothetical protein CDL15_Pgr025348 [Punica granatum]